MKSRAKKSVSYPLLAGAPVAFSEAYPDVVSLRVEIETASLGSRGSWVVSLDDFPGEVLECCQDMKCHDGGFPLMKFLRPHLAARSTVAEGGIGCCGHQVLMRKRRPCSQHFRAKAAIEYRDPPSK